METWRAHKTDCIIPQKDRNIIDFFESEISASRIAVSDIIENYRTRNFQGMDNSFESDVIREIVVIDTYTGKVWLKPYDVAKDTNTRWIYIGNPTSDKKNSN